MNTQKRRLLIDTDTASDDAVAIVMALRHPAVNVDALTVVYGNVPLAQASLNARYTVELCGQSTPVYEGCARPLLREAAHAEWFHGPDGMGDMNYPAPGSAAMNGSAIDQIISRFRAEPDTIELVTLGPLTNIATALQREPQLAKWVKHCFIMGGAACTVGNVTPAAEYNIWCDPEAAKIVFHADMPITMIGWELSRSAATLSDREIQQVRSLDTEFARFAMDCNAHALRAVREIQGETGLALADPVAMAVALEPQCCVHRSSHYVDISTDAELTRGMTVVDQLNVTGKAPNVEVCWKLDALQWKNLLHRSLV